MPVNWSWKRKLGTMTFKNNKGKYKINIYCANCLGALIYDFKEKNNETGKMVDMYQFYGFWNDDKHLKRCLGITKNNYNFKENIYQDLVKLELNTFYDDAWKIAKLFSKAFKGNLKITMYYKKQG